MVGALDPSCSRAVFIANLSENVVSGERFSVNHCLVECSL